MRPRAASVCLLGVLVAAQLSDPGPSALSQVRRAQPIPPAPRYVPPGLLPDPVLPDTSASLGNYIYTHLDEFVTDEYTARKAQRREFQRAGYAGILDALLALDPVSALLAYLRTRLQLEYSLPHNTIYFRGADGVLYPLPEDWTFPADPWKE